MKWISATALSLLFFTAGCSPTEVAESGPDSAPVSNVAMKSEPANAISVGKARETVKKEQDITLVGRIGGSSEPFIEGMSVFTIVDLSVPYCADDEGCPTPWDYCCTQDQVKDNIATIKIVDESQQPLENDARKIPGVKELATVVVHGKAMRDDQGNLIVSTKNVFVRPSE